jgi:hypothetical protein
MIEHHFCFRDVIGIPVVLPDREKCDIQLTKIRFFPMADKDGVK